MKKFVLLAACLLLPASMALSGCGKVQEVEQVTGPMIAQPNETTMAAAIEKPVIQVGDTTLELGKFTVEDMVNAGAAFNADNETKSIDYWEDPLKERQITFTYGDTSIVTQVKNLQNAKTQLKDSVVWKAYFSGQAVCGTKGIMIGDTIEQVSEKLGDPYMMVNSEKYSYTAGGASMPQNSRVYCYTSQLDDLVLKFAVDRNTYTVNMIEENQPLDLIMSTKQVTDKNTEALKKAFKKKHTGAMQGTLKSDIDGLADNQVISGKLVGVDFYKFKVLTLDKDLSPEKAEAFYTARQSLRDQAAATSYLCVLYSGALVTGAAQDRYDVYGCFYVPDAYLTYDGQVKSACSQADFLEVEGVFLDEREALEAIFQPTQEYKYSDYATSERAL